MKASRRGHSSGLQVATGIFVASLAALAGCAATPATSPEEVGESDPQVASDGGRNFDGDGDEDMDVLVSRSGDVVTSSDEGSLFSLFRNNGDGTFTDSSLEDWGTSKSDTTWGPAAFCDLDDDGDMDLIIVHRDEVPGISKQDR